MLPNDAPRQLEEQCDDCEMPVAPEETYVMGRVEGDRRYYVHICRDCFDAVTSLPDRY